MARIFCAYDPRAQLRHLCFANDCKFAHPERRVCVMRASFPAEFGGLSFKLSSELNSSERSRENAMWADDRRRVRSRGRIWVSGSLGLEKSCCPAAFGGGGGATASVAAAEEELTAVDDQKEVLRGLGFDLQSGDTTNSHDSGATPCSLKFWSRSLCCTVIAIVLSLPQTLGADSRTLSDCKDLVAYYAPLHGLEGHNLKTRLHDLIKDHKVFRYIEVWDALKVLDEATDDPSSVIEIYSLKKVPKSLQASTDGWNREHLWPRSYGLVMGHPEFTDLQNLRPSDVNVNSSRGNKFFGECTTSLSSQCLVPANKEAAPDTGSNKDIWMPPAQVRGDIARALMYMAVRYGSDQPAGSQELQLTDSPNIGNAQMGRLSDLLRWNEIDPPSDAEKLRNNRVCSLYQHNRNPFVDHPEYARLIWGVANTPSKQGPSTAANPMDDKTDAWINEFHYDNEGVDQDEFVEVAVGPKVNPAQLTVVLYSGADGKAYRSLPLADDTVFSRGEDIGKGLSLFVAKLPSGSIQNGPRDALALVQEDSTTHFVHVLQFLSYEGTLKALDGPAEGLVSLDILVQEGSKTRLGSSLGLTGSGQVYKDFQWSEVREGASPGNWNLGQTILRPFRQLELSIQ